MTLKILKDRYVEKVREREREIEPGGEIEK